MPLPLHTQRHKFRRPPGRKFVANVPDARDRHSRHEKDGITRHVWLGRLVFGAQIGDRRRRFSQRGRDAVDLFQRPGALPFQFAVRM